MNYFFQQPGTDDSIQQEKLRSHYILHYICANPGQFSETDYTK